MPYDPHFRADVPVNVNDSKFTIYPRALNITWGNDKRYWNLPRRDPKKQEGFAELKQVCWLEVTGSTEKELVPGKQYEVRFVVSLRPDAFGWDDCSVYIMAKIGKKGSFSYKKISLAGKPTDLTKFTIPNDDDKLTIEVADPKEPKPSENDDLELYFGLYEVWTNRWKGGLRIHHAFVEGVHSTDKSTQSK
ncbi:unnamed protein product [Citrullus colocynthis]|uniref:Protein PHLOEM PROTEIN 2-LIKE A9-like n=1 Tax=Citrullus colocynthis TaxID=252529 RepID=A0ABP0XU07_9ROSI